MRWGKDLHLTRLLNCDPAQVLGAIFETQIPRQERIDGRAFRRAEVMGLFRQMNAFHSIAGSIGIVSAADEGKPDLWEIMRWVLSDRKDELGSRRNGCRKFDAVGARGPHHRHTPFAAAAAFRRTPGIDDD